jgi:hypothetical protein
VTTKIDRNKTRKSNRNTQTFLTVDLFSYVRQTGCRKDVDNIPKAIIHFSKQECRSAIDPKAMKFLFVMSVNPFCKTKQSCKNHDCCSPNLEFTIKNSSQAQNHAIGCQKSGGTVRLKV